MKNVVLYPVCVYVLCTCFRVGHFVSMYWFVVLAVTFIVIHSFYSLWSPHSSLYILSGLHILVFIFSLDSIFQSLYSLWNPYSSLYILSGLHILVFIFSLHSIFQSLYCLWTPIFQSSYSLWSPYICLYIVSGLNILVFILSLVSIFQSLWSLSTELPNISTTTCRIHSFIDIAQYQRTLGST